MPYSKLDEGLTKSSLWSEPLHVRVVYVSFLAEKDANGFVNVAYSAMQRICNVSKEQFDEAIKILESPDFESRTKDYEGRRIERFDGGWIVLNHEKYRLPEEIKREQTRERVQRFREKHKESVTKALHSVTHELHPVSVSASLSSSSDVLKDKNKKTSKQTEVTWRTSLDEYLKSESSGYSKLISDPQWIAEQQRFNPNLNILLSLEKAHLQFWGTEAGWKHKKKSRSKDLDWERTYINALSMRSNQVWKTRGETESTIDNLEL